MKQTNNAIKFLMAQYRAIFKNANIAMVAAMAAAALAAGSANAAKIADWSAITSGTLDGSAEEKALAIVGADKKNESAGFDLTLSANHSDGAHKITGAAGFTDFNTAKDKTTSITLNATTGKANGVGLNIGAATSADTIAKLNITDFNVYAGTATVTGQAAGAQSVVAAKNIQIGGSADASATVATDPAGVVTLAGHGVIGDVQKTEKFDILTGGELKFTAAGAKAASKNGITLNGGKISVAAAATDAAIDGALTLNSGSVEITAAAGSLAVGGALTATGGKIVNSGTLVLKKDSTFGGELDLDNAGAIDFAGVASGTTATLTVTKDIFENKLFKGDGKVSGAGTAGANYKIKIDGTTADKAVDLTKLFSKDGAIQNDDFTFTAGNRIVEADYASLANGKYAATVNLSLGTLSAGASNAFAIENGTVEVKDSLVVNGGAASGTLSVTAGTLKLNGAGAEHDVQAKSITLGATGNADTVNLDVLGGGTWSVGDLTLTKGLATVDGGSTLVINGDLTTTGATGGTDGGVLTITNASTLDATAATKLTLTSGTHTSTNSIDVKSGSTIELNADQVFTVTGNTVTLTDGNGTGENKVEKTAIKLSSDSVLQFKTGSGFTLSKAGFDDLIAKLGGNTAIGGFVSFGDDFKLSDVTGGEIALDEVKKGDVYNGATATTANGTVNKDVMLGSIKVTTNDGKVSVDGGKTVILYKAADGNFVSNNKGATDVSVGDAANLTLAGDGAVGAIDGAAANNGNVTFGHSRTGETAGTVTVESIGATNGVASVTVARGDVVVNGKAEQGQPALQLQTKKLSLAQGTSLNADGHEVVVASASATGSADIYGDLTAKSLALHTSGGKATTFNIAKGASVDVDALTLQQSGSLFVGENDGTTTSSATLEVGKLTLAKGSLIVDPAMTDPASIAAVKDLSAKDSNGDAQVLDGKIAVGQNSAVGIGFDTRAEVEQVLTQAGLMADHKFIDTPESVKGALILNNAINVASGNGVLIDASGKKASALATAVTADQFKMEGNAALIVNDSVYKRVNGKLEGVAVTLANGAAGSVSADATSKVILNGDFDANDAGVQIFAGSGAAVNAVSGEIAFETANGVLSGKIDSKGQIGSITVDKTKLDNKFLTVSAPVRDLLKTAIMNQGGVIDKGQIGGKFLSQVANNITDSSGVAADAAAHAATYAGAQQAAVVSVTTMADAMFGRVGAVGVEAASIAATGSQANGGVWLTPMYKSMDADGFNAEGASYGSDVDAAGVAFGADTVNGNMRFGAVFNIGSGDAEGKGNGNGLKDEFDYYGFGIYSAMGFGNFALVGDASMTVVSHDVEGFGLRGKADTTAVTMGITGQYTVATPMVDVTPHLGARFIRLNTDSYDLISADGVLATTDFDVQNVFSVPLGVTLSKAFVAGGWSLAPSADLTVTFNSGDTEAKSTTTFTGAPAIGLNTEVLDEVTYGLTVGLGAQYGAFGTSFGINYTGSENTDSFGVNAQARYMF